MVADRVPLRMPLFFKGDRDYVHGPDLYTASLHSVRLRLGSDAWIDRITFSTMIRSDCMIVERPVDGASASISIRKGGNLHYWSIVATGLPIEIRHDYDEEGVVGAARIEGSRIGLPVRSRATAAEEVVALTKRLHQHLRPRPGSKWIVVGFRLDQPLENRTPGPFTVELIRSLGDALTISRIHAQGHVLGEVNFSCIPPGRSAR